MMYYKLVDLSFGQVGLVWGNETSPGLVRVVLPEEGISTVSLIRRVFPGAASLSHATIEAVGRNLKKYDRGVEVNFLLPELETASAGEFSRRVWQATTRIPRGKVKTYGQVAKEIAARGAARAVGTALGKNPFPLIIPCHRVIRADGEPGGFSGGGAAVKKRLLEREGVLFDRRGRVAAVSLHSAFFPGGRLSGT